MLAWVDKFEHSAPQDLPSRNIRPWLSNGLIIDFLLYGVVYMSSMLGLIDAHTERKGFFVLTFGSKIAYCAAFVFIRADEYHKTLTDVLRKVSVSNVGMLAAHEKIDTDVDFFLLGACLFQFLGDPQRFGAVFSWNFVEPCV